MKRVPVTQASYKKIGGAQNSKGVPNSGVKVGKPDKEKFKAASYLGWGRFGENFGRPSMIGASSTFYNNSYMSGGHTGGLGDVPPYIAMLNEANGGVMYYPATLKEKFEFYRFFYRFSPFVRAAVNLNTDLPMSRLQLRMPKMEDKEKSQRIQKFYESMMEEIHLFDKLHSMLFENNILGNCVVFIQYSEKKKRWDKMTILPPEEVTIAKYPMSDEKMIQYRPELLISVMAKYDFPLDSYENYVTYVKSLPEQDQKILRDVSYDLVKQLRDNNNILPFDSDPYHGDGDDKIGSFAYHFTEKRHEYQDWGVSPLECVLVPLLQQTHYQYTQVSLSSRNMTPRNVVTAQGISNEALDDLRDQVDQSMLSPDYSIVTNFNIDWNQIGAENRLIDLQRENEVIENQLFAGLGVTREILTGEGLYSGNKITVEIMNTKYMIIRERLKNFVEEYLFKPVALQNGFYEDDEDGNRTWLYPKLGFTRLTIRDNQEVFDQLFQLYQKGSLPIGVILDIFNINSDDVDEELRKDMFTVKDATYNEMLRQVYTDLGTKIVESTDLAKQMAESITGPLGNKLKYSGEDADSEGGDEFGGDEGGGMDEFSEEGSGEEMPELPGEEPAGEEETTEEAGPGEEGTPEEEAPAGEAGEAPSQSGDEAAKSYLDRIKKEKGESPAGNEEAVKSYLDGIRKERGGDEDAKAKDYIRKVTGDHGDEHAKRYLDKVLSESGKESEDRRVMKYLNSFLGDNGDEGDVSEEAQSAGLG